MKDCHADSYFYDLGDKIQTYPTMTKYEKKTFLLDDKIMGCRRRFSKVADKNVPNILLEAYFDKVDTILRFKNFLWGLRQWFSTLGG